MKIKKLIINRYRWGVGGLLESNNTMCCLGFLAIACGAAPDEIEGENYPTDVPNVDWPAKFIKLGVGPKTIKSSDLAIKATKINDSNDFEQKVKEAKLIKLFKKAGIKLSFVDT